MEKRNKYFIYIILLIGILFLAYVLLPDLFMYLYLEEARDVGAP